MELELANQTVMRRWVLARGEARRGADGRLEESRGIIQNVTGRRKTEEAFRMSEARLREAQKIGRMGDWETGIQTNALS